MTVLDEEWQRVAVNSISHEAFMAGQAWQQAATQYERPSVIYKPTLRVDGDKWCALYGDNLQDGVAGFGKSPADAMYDFDQAWHKKLPDVPASLPAAEDARDGWKKIPLPKYTEYTYVAQTAAAEKERADMHARLYGRLCWEAAMSQDSKSANTAERYEAAKAKLREHWAVSQDSKGEV
jgi:hypothetical protein